MAISVDGVADGVASPANSLSYNITIGNGLNRIIFVGVILLLPTAGSPPPPSLTSITVDGSPVTLIHVFSYIDTATGNYVVTYLYYQTAPTIGSIAVAMATLNNATIVSFAASYFGAKQTSPINAAVETGTGPASSFTIGVTPSVANCWAIAMPENHTVAQTVTSGGVIRSGSGGGYLMDSNGIITNGVLHNFVLAASSGNPWWSGIMAAFESAAAPGNYYGQVGYYRKRTSWRKSIGGLFIPPQVSLT